MRAGGIILFMAASLALSAQDGTLDAVKAEPNLERRSVSALHHAGKTIDRLRGLYREGGLKAVEQALSQVRSAVDLARQSLVDSGKNPRRSPKYFKQAELKTRELARRLYHFGQDVSFDERSAVDGTREHVEKVHDLFLEDVMTKRK